MILSAPAGPVDDLARLAAYCVGGGRYSFPAQMLGIELSHEPTYSWIACEVSVFRRERVQMRLEARDIVV